MTELGSDVGNSGTAALLADGLALGSWRNEKALPKTE
jgi:hypothetical protein